MPVKRSPGDEPARSNPIRVFIVDDHPVVRQGLGQLLVMAPDMDCCGEAGSAQEAMKRLEAAKADVAVVDLSLRDSSGLELVKDLHARQPGLPVVVLSIHDEGLYAERVLRAGARGYVMKDEAEETILVAIRRVAAGGIHLSDRMSGRLLTKFVDGSSESAGGALGRLSDRELEVYDLIGRGVTTREIAGRLNLSIKTVEAHRENIKKKLKLGDAVELLQHAFRWVQDQTNS